MVNPSQLPVTPLTGKMNVLPITHPCSPSLHIQAHAWVIPCAGLRHKIVHAYMSAFLSVFGMRPISCCRHVYTYSRYVRQLNCMRSFAAPHDSGWPAGGQKQRSMCSECRCCKMFTNMFGNRHPGPRPNFAECFSLAPWSCACSMLQKNIGYDEHAEAALTFL